MNNIENNNKLLSFEIVNCSNIVNLNITDNKSKMVLHGEKFNKEYEKMRGYTLLFKDNKLLMKITSSTLLNKLKCKSSNPKLVKVLKDIYNNNQSKKYNISFTNFLNFTSNLTLNDIHDIEKKSCAILSYAFDIYKLYGSIGLHMVSSVDNCHNILENDCIPMLKSIDYAIINMHGNVVFGDLNFINNLQKKCTHDKILTTIISNDTIKGINDHNLNNFLFIKMSELTHNTDINNNRLIIYHPSSHDMLNIINLIKLGLAKPSYLWIVMPYNNQLPSDILRIMYWSHVSYFPDNLTSIISYKYIETLRSDNTKSTKSIVKNESNNENKNKSKIKIEKLGYKLTDLEKNVMNTISYDNISSVDKLCLYNLGKQYPNTLKHDIANDIYCNICASSIDNINISYLSCGHIFCSSCVLRIININKHCPYCRQQIKYSNVTIPNLISSKYIVFGKLVKDLIKKNEKILIFVDNFTISKKVQANLLSNYLKISIDVVNCTDVINNNTSLFICPVVNDIKCKIIKNIKNIIMLVTNDYNMKSDSLGYDYLNNINDVNLWTFCCADLFR